MLATKIFIIISAKFIVIAAEVFTKCCDYEFILNDSLQCISSIQDNKTQTIFHITNESSINSVCYTNNSRTILAELQANSTQRQCKDVTYNGSVITLSCEVDYDNATSSHQCDSILTLLDFWGATIVVFATILYTIPYFIVIVIYCLLPELRVRAYDKSVVSFNCSYIILNAALIFIGFNELCHKVLPDIVYAILGLIIVYLTQSCCIWLFVICIDMTLVITRFHWSPASDSRNRDDRRKFFIYSAWTWSLSLLPFFITAIMEFNSFLSENSVLRPKLSDFHGEHNKALLFYCLIFPILTLFSNTILFIYTTYKMIRIQRDNAILNRNTVKNARKKYFVYLKLYLIMDAPWLSGALSATFPDLWYLKFVRIIQPILMLIVIVPRKRVIEAFGCLKNTTKRIRMYRVRKGGINSRDIEEKMGKNQMNILLSENVIPVEG